MTNFLSYEMVMVLKNIALVASGVVIALVAISFFSAYYMMNSVRDSKQSKTVAFTIEDETIRWTPPRTLSEALETWYDFILWHISGSKKVVVARSILRGKVIFLCSIFVFIVFLIISIWLSVQIQLQ